MIILCHLGLDVITIFTWILGNEDVCRFVSIYLLQNMVQNLGFLNTLIKLLTS